MSPHLFLLSSLVLHCVVSRSTSIHAPRSPRWCPLPQRVGVVTDFLGPARGFPLWTLVESCAELRPYGTSLAWSSMAWNGTSLACKLDEGICYIRNIIDQPKSLKEYEFTSYIMN